MGATWDDFATNTLRHAEREEEVGRLTVTKGPDTGRDVVMVEGVALVGTGPLATLRLTDNKVSRMHCELRREEGGLRLRDLGSKNGTWLGGHRVYEAVLKPGAEIRLGASVIEVSATKQSRVSIDWAGGDRFGDIIGGSPSMQAVFAQMARVLGSDHTVLVRGETGTGKELVARALHDLGPRSGGPFVVVDGAGLTQQLADVELFGHERGAFTGAIGERIGAFERAHGGTLFIDELGDIPLDVQTRFLRVLEQRAVQRVGGSKLRGVDVRVISATHQPLERMVSEGTFREDLLHRLKVIEISVPPLRERGNDVERIALEMVERLAPADANVKKDVEKAIRDRAGYPWPGNVRELRNLVRRVVALGDAGTFTAPIAHGDALSVRIDLPFAEAKQEWVSIFERLYLGRLLDETGGNISEAARRSELSRVHMTRLVDRYSLKRRGPGSRTLG